VEEAEKIRMQREKIRGKHRKWKLMSGNGWGGLARADGADLP